MISSSKRVACRTTTHVRPETRTHTDTPSARPSLRTADLQRPRVILRPRFLIVRVHRRVAALYDPQPPGARALLASLASLRSLACLYSSVSAVRKISMPFW